MDVRWLGHSTVVLETGGVRLLSDPLLLRHARPLRRRGPAPDRRAWQGTDVVLLSHLHHDHAELGSLRLLGAVPVVTTPGCAQWLQEQGITGAVGLGPDEWWTAPGGSVRIRLAPAVHGHRPMPHRPNEATGHLVRGSTATVWVAGDTELYDGMRELPALAGAPIDLAVVPVAGWGPRLSGGHLDPAGAAQACARMGARAAVPVHWGTLHVPGGRHLPPGWLDRAGPAFVTAVRATAPGCRAVLLSPGGRWRVPAGGSASVGTPGTAPDEPNGRSEPMPSNESGPR